MTNEYKAAINSRETTIITAWCDVMEVWNANAIIDGNIAGQTRYATLTEEDAIMEAITQAKATMNRTTLATMDELAGILEDTEYATREAAIEQDDEGSCEGWDNTREWESNGITIREWRSDRNHLSVSGIGPDRKATREATKAAYVKAMDTQHGFDTTQ